MYEGSCLALYIRLFHEFASKLYYLSLTIVYIFQYPVLLNHFYNISVINKVMKMPGFVLKEVKRCFMSQLETTKMQNSATLQYISLTRAK